jgi:glutamate--cysteine ligase
MALISQTSPSYCTHAEVIRYKAGNKMIFSMINNVEASKMKELRAGFLSSSCNSAKKAQILHIDGPGVGCKRGHQVIVAASPPTEDSVIATEPLTKEDLVSYLASGCKPKEKWRYSYQFYIVL